MHPNHLVLNPKVCNCSLAARREILKKVPFLKEAATSTHDMLLQNLHSRGMAEGAEISPMKLQNGIFGIVANGAYKVFRYIKDEQYVIFDILTAGDFFHLSLPDSPSARMFTFPDQIQALTTSCLLYMDSSKLDPLLMKDPKVFPGYITELSQRMASLNERFIRFMAFQADHRIAFLLLFLQARGQVKIDNPRLIPFNITRKDIAAMAGLTLETASRVLSAFEKDNIIRSGRGWIEILNPDKLRKLSQTEEL